MAARSPSANSMRKKKKRKPKATASSVKKRGKKKSGKNGAAGCSSDVVASAQKKAEEGTHENTGTTATDDVKKDGASEASPRKKAEEGSNEKTDAAAVDDAKKDTLPVSRRTFLDYFWTLASTDQSDRVDAANGIVSFLVAEQAKVRATVEDENIPSSSIAFSNCSENLRYALKRLVKGLQSSRAGARQGFSLALVGILQHPAFSKIVSIRDVLSFGETVLDYTLMKKRHEARECMFGRVFLHMAVHRSNRLTVPEDVVRVTQDLVALAHKKPFLREICLETVGDIATAAPLAICRDTVLPVLLSDIAAFRSPSGDPDSGDDATDPLSPADLALAFVLRNRIGALKLTQDLAIRPEFQNLFRLTEHSSMRSWLEPLKASSGVFPRVHSVWAHMFEAMGHHEKPKKSQRQKKSDPRNASLQRCLSMWQTVVEPHFFRSASHERKYLGFRLMTRFLQYLQRRQHHDHCAQIITPNLVNCIYNNVMDESATLHDAAVKAVRSLLTQTPLVRVTVAVNLMAASRHARINSHSAEGKGLVQQLLSYSQEVIPRYIFLYTYVYMYAYYV